jgi:hypothetical protein
MQSDRAAVLSDGRSRRHVLAVLLGSIVGLIAMHKDNPTFALEELLPPTRPIERIPD